MSKRRIMSLVLASMLAAPLFVFGVAQPASAAVCVDVTVAGVTHTVCTP